MKQFLTRKECFVKFGKANDYILNKLLKICKLQLAYSFNDFLYKCRGHINFSKIFLTNLQRQINRKLNYRLMTDFLEVGQLSLWTDAPTFLDSGYFSIWNWIKPVWYDTQLRATNCWMPLKYTNAIKSGRLNWTSLCRLFLCVYH